MAGHGDLQELLRMLTSRKVSMMAAMGHVKALQDKGLRSIEQLAQAPLNTVEAAIGDVRLAKSLQTACSKHQTTTTTTTTKRTAGDALESSSPSKKTKLQPHKRQVDYGALTSDELERSLALPLEEDETTIRATTLVTNRAPLLLAFAVELLRFTMPEQPPSSRLSLAQAVVSANSRAKARSLGLEGGGDTRIPDGQPTVRLLGRDVPVLKRGDYSWSPEAVKETAATVGESLAAVESEAQHPKKTWTASQRLASRGSVFIAHAASLSSPSQRSGLVRQLMVEKPSLETATHNAWAMRSSYGNSPLVQEASFDDGETGCGDFMLGLMRESGVKNTVVVLTRWFGGVMLGPDRWRLMRECVDDALSCRSRTGTTVAGEAVWALDEDESDGGGRSTAIGMAVHRPETARNYLLRSFVGGDGSPGGEKTKKKGKKKAGEEDDDVDRYENLGRLLGALRLLFGSWAGVLSRRELDQRAWSWYVAVRPEVEAGPGGGGAKGPVRLERIVELARREETKKRE
ncbi:hypothetical protein CDD80_296 [Ophiocordyceps camponoti-rufipedis]|uniref:Impact N-terminal domain-containing protein n=1 Tax=Ophiocordyceps camponoti-rufipedis TaxID=2004952 RepID=A0A2C5XD47_9HYPO|nr:hypothetical protein CDD80_296 [Ophiocordyceps camponoti-rufipedis]